MGSTRAKIWASLVAVQVFLYGNVIADPGSCEQLSIPGGLPFVESELMQTAQGMGDTSSLKEESRISALKSWESMQSRLRLSHSLLIGDSTTTASEFEKLRLELVNSSSAFSIAKDELDEVVWLAVIHEAEIPIELLLQSQQKNGQDVLSVFSEGAAILRDRPRDEFDHFLNNLASSSHEMLLVRGLLVYLDASQYQDRSDMTEAVFLLEELVKEGQEKHVCSELLSGLAAMYSAKGRLILAKTAKEDPRDRRPELRHAREMIEIARRWIDPVNTPKLWANAHIVSGDIYAEAILDEIEPSPHTPLLERLRERSYELGNLY